MAVKEYYIVDFLDVFPFSRFNDKKIKVLVKVIITISKSQLVTMVLLNLVTKKNEN